MQCQAITISTKVQCKKKAIASSEFCTQHKNSSLKIKAKGDIVLPEIKENVILPEIKENENYRRYVPPVAS